jgi:IstB-like ATP binding protein
VRGPERPQRIETKPAISPPEVSTDGAAKKMYRALVYELATARFIGSGRTCSFLGRTGTGKSRLAQAIGRAAIQGYRVIYRGPHALLDRLLHHAHVLKCGPRSWRPLLVRWRLYDEDASGDQILRGGLTARSALSTISTLERVQNLRKLTLVGEVA